jgi:hypothetical protein
VTATQAAKPATPWYLRIKTLVLTAGALAGAVLGVLALTDRLAPADQSDVPRIERVWMVRAATLGQFAPAGGDLDPDLDLSPAPKAAAHALPTVRLVVGRLGGADATPTPAPLAPPTDPSPTDSPPTPSPTDTPTGTPTPTPTSTPSTTPTPTPTPTPSQEPTLESSTFVVPENWPPTKEYLGSVATEVELVQVESDSPKYDPQVVTTLFALGYQPTNEEGEDIPAEQVAERIVDALDEVETTPNGETVDPLGWTVAVDLRIEGMAGESLLLTWQLDGAEVPDNWAAENLAYRVKASTPLDVGVAEIWVPDLAASGGYVVNVKLARESNPAEVMALGKSDPLPNP